MGGRYLKDTRVAYVLSLGVVKEFRKNGIGKNGYVINLYGIKTNGRTLQLLKRTVAILLYILQLLMQFNNKRTGERLRMCHSIFRRIFQQVDTQ